MPNRFGDNIEIEHAILIGENCPKELKCVYDKKLKWWKFEKIKVKGPKNQAKKYVPPWDWSETSVDVRYCRLCGEKRPLKEFFRRTMGSPSKLCIKHTAEMRRKHAPNKV